MCVDWLHALVNKNEEATAVQSSVKDVGEVVQDPLNEVGFPTATAPVEKKRCSVCALNQV